MTGKGMDGSHLISDELWQRIKPLLPPAPPRPNGNHPHMDDRRAMEAVFYVLYTGCKWEELPSDFGARNAKYVRFQEWRKAGVFDRMWQVGILTQDEFWTLIRQGKRINITKNGKE